MLRRATVATVHMHHVGIVCTLEAFIQSSQSLTFKWLQDFRAFPASSLELNAGSLEPMT